MLKKLLEEIRGHPFVYFFLSLILVGAFFVRLYKIDTILGFYFDQGRDAKVIWDLWHSGKPFLVGPVTGLEGVFLGPLFYWLITPFYLIGGGNPVYPAIFIGVLASLGVFFVYLVGFKAHSRSTGIIAACIFAFSYFIVYYGRWLANPAPILFVSPLLYFSLLKIANKEGEIWWVIAVFLIALSFQFELASAFFYLPAFLVFTFWAILRQGYGGHGKLNNKTLLTMFFVFFITFIPQTLFNFKHDNILLGALGNALKDRKEINLTFWEFIKFRFDFYYRALTSIIFPQKQNTLNAFLLAAIGIYIANAKRLLKAKFVITFLIFIISPIIGFLFFRANEAKVYDYYLVGYFVPFIILFSAALSQLAKNWLGIALLAVFFLIFFQTNIPMINSYLKKGIAPFTFKDQISSVKWVLDDARDNPFSVDVWVAPIIPHAYDYLFLWLGETKRPIKDADSLYTLYEEPGNLYPERNAWLSQKNKEGIVEEEVQFSGITVQRRTKTR